MLRKNLRTRVTPTHLFGLLVTTLVVGVSPLLLHPRLGSDWSAPKPEDLAISTSTTDLQSAVLGAVGVWLDLDRSDRVHRRYYQPPKQFQGQVVKQVKLPPGKRAIALTFDDGPWPVTTDKVLDILQQHQVKATFFVLGRNIPNFPQQLQRVANEGHAIGNHSWSHGYGKYSPAAAQRELDRTAQAIAKYTDFKTMLFRPPGGYLTNGLVAQAHAQKQTTIHWSIDDTYSGSVDKAVNNILKNAQPGGIVLMHDGGGDRRLTLQALPRVIIELKRQGYQLVTIPQLLDMAAAK